MKFNICVVQPKEYIYSMAFWELAELLLYSLRELKHEASINFNRIDKSSKNIVIGFHLLDINYANELPKDTVLVNLEQFLAGTVWNENILAWVKNYEVWDYSIQNIEAFKSKGFYNIKLLKIGYQKELNRIHKNSAPDIDVLFYGSINERRATILESINSLGIKLHTACGVFGKNRDNLIARSKLVLNLHYYDSQIFEIVRVFYLLTNAIPIIGEVNKSTVISEHFKNAIIGVDYGNLVATCEQLIQSPQKTKILGLTGFEIFSRYPQKIYTEFLLG